MKRYRSVKLNTDVSMQDEIELSEDDDELMLSEGDDMPEEAEEVLDLDEGTEEI